MSTPATPVAPAAPAKPLTAIQMIERELAGYIQQKEQMIANLHALDGAIQSSQHLLLKLREAEQAAIAEGKKLIGEVKAEAEKVVSEVDGTAKSAENKVVSIADAAK